MKTIGILGLGNFGYALLNHFDKSNKGMYQLAAFDRKSEVVTSLQKTNTHPLLFSEMKLSSDISYSTDPKEIAKQADYLILAISSSAIPPVLQNIKDVLKPGVVLINTAKALEYTTGQRHSEVIREILGNTPYIYAVAAGGTIAADLFRREPLGMDIACEDEETLLKLMRLFNSYNLSVYPTHDVTGVEYASALKNIVSILAGIINGMEYSYGAETHIISRAAGEVEDLVVNKLGGQPETFSLQSQCWGNDLWMSCTGNTRNRKLGILIGKTKSVEHAVDEMKKQGKTVEGVQTVQVLDKLADLSHHPLLDFINKLFAGKKNVEDIKEVIFNLEL